MRLKQMAWWASGLVVLTVLSRWIPHPHNFTPVIGLAAFAGARLPSRTWGLAVALGAMWLSDLVLGFHSTMWSVYLSLAILVVLGDLVLRNEDRFLRKVGWLTSGGSLLFFLLTNFAVWLSEGMYPMTFEGLVTCFVAAIPFFPATLVSSWVYGFALFGIWSVLEARVFKSKAPQLQLS